MGSYEADKPESNMYPDVIETLTDEFLNAPRGDGALLLYGQSEAGKESLMYGDNLNLTPRTLPPVGKAPPALGLVLAAIKRVIVGLHQQGKLDVAEEDKLCMGCVMLHIELLRDLLSPQSRVKLSESEDTSTVQLEGLHWQSITDVKEAEGSSACDTEQVSTYDASR